MNKKKYTLKQLLTIQNGKDYRHLSAGQVPVYGTGGIMTYVDDFLFDGESVLLPRKGTLDNIMFVDGKFWTVDTMYWTKINTDIVLPRFLYYYLTLLDLSCRDSGSALPSMTFDSYYTLEVEIPDKPEQERILSVLVAIDEKLKVNDEIANNLQGFIRDLYNRYFIQYDFLTEKGPYKKSGGELANDKHYPISYPSGWDVVPLSEMVKNVTTGLNPRDNFKLSKEGARYITVKNLTTNGEIDFRGCDFVDKKAAKMIRERSEVSIGDILFASIAPLGRCHIVMDEPDNWEINESVFCMKPADDFYKFYLYELFTGDYFIEKAENSSTGSVFNGIRISTMLDMYFLKPSKCVLETFNNEVEVLFKKADAIYKENEKLKQLKDDLLPLLMNGQIISE